MYHDMFILCTINEDRKELVQYLPPGEVPAQISKKKRSLGPVNSHVMETPSPILYKRSRTHQEGEELNAVKKLKEDGPEDKVCYVISYSKM